MRMARSWSSVKERGAPIIGTKNTDVIVRDFSVRIYHLARLEGVVAVYSLYVSEITRFPETFLGRMSRAHLGLRVSTKPPRIYNLTSPVHRNRMIC